MQFRAQAQAQVLAKANQKAISVKEKKEKANPPAQNPFYNAPKRPPMLHFLILSVPFLQQRQQRQQQTDSKPHPSNHQRARTAIAPKPEKRGNRHDLHLSKICIYASRFHSSHPFHPSCIRTPSQPE
ncbi:predicted protein [Plenodomus lingam JN3]|uniref:Predicted protein n=1 Tax=Leptosphaeria maculans (strain JN3 / isolate v23.1.3 / race Av1-4-5-6-7-8) TaxID=985895 RepID=E5R5G9_LEPMJ|nr:predicted protein [Plenodomus lingam JN3]CBX92139.1 predicted protein [Plenodomus lingam JN3]